MIIQKMLIRLFDYVTQKIYLKQNKKNMLCGADNLEQLFQDSR